MGLGYLMDTNVIIDYTGKKFAGSAEVHLDAAFNQMFYYSIISRIELLGFNADAVALQALQDFLALGHQYYVTDDIARQTIFIRRYLPKLKTPDAIIAATALVYNLTLLSRNISDFKNVHQLNVMNATNFKFRKFEFIISQKVCRAKTIIAKGDTLLNILT